MFQHDQVARQARVASDESDYALDILNAVGKLAGRGEISPRWVGAAKLAAIEAGRRKRRALALLEASVDSR